MWNMGLASKKPGLLLQSVVLNGNKTAWGVYSQPVKRGPVNVVFSFNLFHCAHSKG